MIPLESSFNIGTHCTSLGDAKGQNRLSRPERSGERSAFRRKLERACSALLPWLKHRGGEWRACRCPPFPPAAVFPGALLGRVTAERDRSAPGAAAPVAPGRISSAAPKRRRAPLSLPSGAPALMPGCGAAPPAGGVPTPPVSEPAKPEKAAAAASGRELEVRGAASAAVRGALELAEARRRLLEAEGRRRLVSELESRVQHLHRVFLAAELRMAGRAESLGRLGSGVGQAELHLAAHGQRLKKSARRYKKARPPALLASALALGSCVPWAACRVRRGGGPEPPESPFRRSLQGAAASTPRERRKMEPLSSAGERKGGGAAP
ncbi:TMF-regulated nuclear protein 1 [Candoia aspera]|uniref:TMF-regulated nuclear protein 1 n=1 Tax=Candoia aspera TaxID=51853 RepID=UPI002FD80174